MSKNRILIVPAVLLGIVLVVLAVVSVAEPASSLPSFIPGHQAGSSHHHVKHGIAARLEPREHEACEAEQHRGDRVLDVMVR